MGFNEAENFSGVGMPAELLLGEEQGPVHSDLEHATRPLDKSDLGFRMGLLDLRLQTGGAWTVVSNDAVLNRNFQRTTLGQRSPAAPAPLTTPIKNWVG